MWERFQQILDSKGSPVHLNTEVLEVKREGTRIQSVIIEQHGQN